MECHTNGHQATEVLKPVAVSNLQSMKVTAAGGVAVQAPVAQSLYDIQSQAASEHVPNPPNHPALFHQLNSDVVLGTPLESPVAPGSTQSPPNVIGVQIHRELNASKYSDPSLDSSAHRNVVGVSAALPESNHSQPAIPTTLPHSLTNASIEQLGGEHLRSVSDAPLTNSLLPSLTAPIQPASRFRKARIHETVEQWGSNRLSFHDCRLKAVPDWVSYLQTKPNETFSNQIAQRGRCLYCFVPGNFGK